MLRRTSLQDKMRDSIDLFGEQLASAGSVLIVLPKSPNFDQVAAGLSLYLSLTSYGKSTTVACSTPMIVEFNRLVGVNKVTQGLGSKNLTIRFANFRADNIERVSYNIENGEFMLSVIPKPDASAPKVDQVELSYSGVGSDLAILVDFGRKEELGNFSQKQEIFAQKVFLLGTKPAQGIAAQELVLPETSCASEVVARIINRLSLPQDSDIAGNLYLGIQAGTGRFSSPRVSAETFELLAQLLRAGAKGEVRQEQRGPQPQQEQEEQPPRDWLQPKIYKGNILP